MRIRQHLPEKKIYDGNKFKYAIIDCKATYSEEKNLSFDFFRSFHHSAAACVGCAR
jgi:hypothetical protein